MALGDIKMSCPARRRRSLEVLPQSNDKASFNCPSNPRKENELLISFVETNKSDLADMFDLLKGSVHQIFKSPEGETGPDLFSIILSKIQKSYNEDKIPVMIHSDALYGSGIDNIHLMESEFVMKSKKPLIILYPATQDGDQLMFLNSRPASKYRCMIVN